MTGKDITKLYDTVVLLRNLGEEALADQVALLIDAKVIADGYIRFVLDDPDVADIKRAVTYITSSTDCAGILRFTIEWVPD